MSKKILDLGKSVHELCTADPEILPILVSLGFPDIAKPGMLATAGRFMTIPKGAVLKKRDIGEIRKAFEAHGYKIKEGTI